MMMLFHILQEMSKLFRSFQILWRSVLNCWHDLQILQYFLMFLFVNDQLKIHWTSFKHCWELKCSARELLWYHFIISALNSFCAKIYMHSWNIMMSSVIFFDQLIMKTLKSILISRMLKFLFSLILILWWQDDSFSAVCRSVELNSQKSSLQS